MSNYSTPILFITYDGLLDPLGGSQILPYLYGIASHSRPLHIISFEKPERFDSGAEQMRAKLLAAGIGWSPLPFTKRFGKIGKLWDLLRMYGTALNLHIRHRFSVVHCRSYQAMQVGCILSRLTGARTIFDMRGLWVDERVDGDIWPQGSRLNRLLYKAYKRIETSLLLCATQVVALTDKVVPELQRLSPRMKAPVTVIPCCADFDHFIQSTNAERQAIRKELGIPANALVLSYLGSLGTWYMLEEMLLLFSAAAKVRDDVQLFFITRDWNVEQEALLKTMGLGHLRSRIHVRAASREQVPALLGVSDIMLSFIKPAYSKIASSPTKLAEAFALGIPVISNTGVGDVEQITQDLDAGAVVDLSNPSVYESLVKELDRIKSLGGSGLRDRARKRFGLEVAQHSYQQIYAALDVLP